MTADREPGQSVGFIGLGLMGLPMTLRLLDRGYRVSVSGREPERVEQALQHGARAASTPGDVARQSDIVMLCVSDADAVADVVFSERGVASGASDTKILVDHSTSDAARTKSLAAELRESTGMGWVDAPVSGGPAAARDGSLAIMCGGSEDDFGRVEAALGALGQRVTHMGPVGSGQVTKMVNQVLAGVLFATLAEAVKLAENSGIDAARVPECLSGGYADSTMLQRIYPKMAARDFDPPQGLAKQMLKDLEMVSELARATSTKTPMADHARDLYRDLVRRGLGDIDTSAILRLYE